LVSLDTLDSSIQSDPNQGSYDSVEQAHLEDDDEEEQNKEYESPDDPVAPSNPYEDDSDGQYEVEDQFQTENMDNEGEEEEEQDDKTLQVPVRTERKKPLSSSNLKKSKSDLGSSTQSQAVAIVVDPGSEDSLARFCFVILQPIPDAKIVFTILFSDNLKAPSSLTHTRRLDQTINIHSHLRAKYPPL
jgi:hypothetical protein